MRPISVLFTNNSLGLRGGSESYLRDVALALLRRGHRPVAFSLVHGETAADLRQRHDPCRRRPHAARRRAGRHPRTSPLRNVDCSSRVPGCSGRELLPRLDPVGRNAAPPSGRSPLRGRRRGLRRPPRPRRRDLAGSGRVAAQLRGSRSLSTTAALPARPARALVLSNYATSAGYTRVIAAACHAAGVTLDVVGASNGNPTDCPAQLLAGYDLVFAKGRTALEALAAGCATVLADRAGAGPLVTPDNYEVLRRRNFGIRELTHGHDVAWYGEQLSKYCARAAADVSARVRAEASIEPAIDRLLGDLHRGNRCAACLGRRLARGGSALLPDCHAAQAVVRSRGAAADARRRSGTGARRARCARTGGRATGDGDASLQTRLQALEARLSESRLVEQQLRARERELVFGGRRDPDPRA